MAANSKPVSQKNPHVQDLKNLYSVGIPVAIVLLVLFGGYLLSIGPSGLLILIVLFGMVVIAFPFCTLAILLDWWDTKVQRQGWQHRLIEFIRHAVLYGTMLAIAAAALYLSLHNVLSVI